MTTQNIIAALYHIAQESEGYKEDFFEKVSQLPDVKYDPMLPQLFQIAGLINELKADMRNQAAKSSKSQMVAAAKRILNGNARKEEFRYPWNENGNQYIMNDHVLVCLISDSRLPLEEMPESLIPPGGVAPFNYEYLFNTIKGNDDFLELPDLASLKTYIKIENAKRKGHKHKDAVRYDFGFYGGMIDAQYLANVMELMPDAKCCTSKSNYHFLFHDDKGNRAVICAMRRKEKEPIQKTQL